MNNFFKKKSVRLCLIILLIIFLLCGALWSLLFFLDRSLGDKIADGVVIGYVQVGGLTKEKARDAIYKAVDIYEKNGVLFKLGDMQAIMSAQAISDAGPDFSYSLFEFNIDESVEQAFSASRNGNIFKRIIDRVDIERGGMIIPLDVEVNESQLEKFLIEHFDKYALKMKETGLKVDLKKDNPIVSISPGAPGRVIDYAKAIEETKANLMYLKQQKIEMQTSLIEPNLNESDILPLIPKMEKLIEHQFIAFEWDKEEWKIDRKEYVEWIKVGNRNNEFGFILDSDLVSAYLDKIADKVEVSARDAKFEIGENGKVEVFEPSRDGLKIDKEATLSNIYDVFFDSGLQKIPLTVVVAEPKISTADVNNFGITELISVGKTNFSGSPENRRHNIRTGISKIDGTLVKPDEEFSTLNTLGEIEEENGFKSELVIKSNETKPEAGGGLCQVSTTLFRATMNAGLPITSRVNHSYRVSYYEPPVGKDATIYSPWPDFKFVNDTGHYILIKGRTEGNEAFFEFWGTKDGRIQKQTEPVVYDYVEPPEPKKIYTDQIPVKTTKCTEHAHTGATAYFDYIVNYLNGEKKETRFTSKYRPWGEVCMQGVTTEEMELIKADEEALQKLLEETKKMSEEVDNIQ